MNARIFLAAALTLIPALRAVAAETFDEALEKAAGQYRQRIERAAEELNATRRRIGDEKAPWLARMRAAEDRIVAAEAETVRIETRQEEGLSERRALLQELESLRKTTAFAGTLANESVKAAQEDLAPGEEQLELARLRRLQQGLEDDAGGASGRLAIDVAQFLLAKTEQALGGYRARGHATLAETNEVRAGVFAFAGPEAFFLPDGSDEGRVLRRRDNAKLPVSYAVPGWPAAQARAFFAGEAGTMIADASGGKALRLKQTTGTAWDHVRKGGVVALAILAVGALALGLIVQKCVDLARLAVDTPATVEAFLALVAGGSTANAERSVSALRRTTRELFQVGLQNLDRPKAILEERLEAVLLEQRLHYERRLPLLAVIATAAPLMGLLGTVVGMVKTFALITVFGTGNAAKLSSGISEVLVATELGLIVAIPALVAHGFLAHRIQKNLSLLERYALEFATAAQSAPIGAGGEPRQESIAS